MINNTGKEEGEQRDPSIAALFECAAPVAENEAFVARVREALDRQSQARRRLQWFGLAALLLFCVVLGFSPALRSLVFAAALLPTMSLVDVSGIAADGGAAIALRWIVELLAPMNSAAGLLALACFFLRRSLLQLWVR